MHGYSLICLSESSMTGIMCVRSTISPSLSIHILSILAIEAKEGTTCWKLQFGNHLSNFWNRFPCKFWRIHYRGYLQKCAFYVTLALKVQTTSTTMIIAKESTPLWLCAQKAKLSIYYRSKAGQHRRTIRHLTYLRVQSLLWLQSIFKHNIINNQHISYSFLN